MFDLSVCLIVKNEEKVIERILNCAVKFADEIIIVDTGSTDSTKQKAQKFTDKIYDFKWNDDFADARNFSFSMATKKYIMWLDADDFITEKNIQKILKLKKQTLNIDVFMCKYLMDFDDTNNANFVFYRERILKREKNFKWEGFVHEVIVPDGIITYTDIEIEHRKPQKNHDTNRNLRIYENAKKQGKIFNPREQYYYSRELFYHKKYSKCISELKKYLKMHDNYSPNILGAYTLIAECFLGLEQYEKALKFCFECLSKFEPTSEICCLIANIFDQSGQKNQAIFWYNSSLNAPKQTSGFIKKNYQKFIPYLALTKLYFDQKNYNKSLHFHELAKQENPNHPSVIFNGKFFKDFLKNK